MYKAAVRQTKISQQWRDHRPPSSTSYCHNTTTNWSTIMAPHSKRSATKTEKHERTDISLSLKQCLNVMNEKKKQNQTTTHATQQWLHVTTSKIGYTVSIKELHNGKRMNYIYEFNGGRLGAISR